jgi:hypothetical protein
MKITFYIFAFLCLVSCRNEESNSLHEICRFYLTTQSGSELGLTQIYNDGTIRVCTGYQDGEYQDTLLHILFNKIPVREYDKDMFSEYHAQVEGKMSAFALIKLKNMLSAVSNENYSIQESKDCVYFAWIGAILSGEREWSFYHFDIDGKMKDLYRFLGGLSLKLLESKAVSKIYPFPGFRRTKQSPILSDLPLWLFFTE